MPKKDFTLASKILMGLLAFGEAAEILLPTPHELQRRAFAGNLFKSSGQFRKLGYYLLRQGYIRMIDKNNQRFVRLTKKGQLKALLDKARLPQPQKWDGKWRLIIFDIPEESHNKRDLLRDLLKRNNFKQLQASVFINPYPLNREAIAYLNEMKLTDYIRIIKVEEMDTDADLRKKFDL